jgi:hypothetical protein
MFKLQFVIRTMRTFLVANKQGVTCATEQLCDGAEKSSSCWRFRGAWRLIGRALSHPGVHHRGVRGDGEPFVDDRPSVVIAPRTSLSAAPPNSILKGSQLRGGRICESHWFRS